MIIFTSNFKTKTMYKILTNQIEALETKQENGTITFDEQAKLCFLIERVEQLIYKYCH